MHVRTPDLASAAPRIQLRLGRWVICITMPDVACLRGLIQKTVSSRTGALVRPPRTGRRYNIGTSAVYRGGYAESNHAARGSRSCTWMGGGLKSLAKSSARCNGCNASSELARCAARSTISIRLAVKGGVSPGFTSEPGTRPGTPLAASQGGSWSRQRDYG